MSYPGKKALDLYNAVGEPTENPDDPLCLITITDRSARCYRGVIERRQYLERLENALGAFLHIRDSIEEIEDAIFDEFRESSEIDALAVREIAAVEALRDLLAGS